MSCIPVLNRRCAVVLLRQLVVLLVLSYFFSAFCAADTWPTDYAALRVKAVRFAGRLLCLVEKITPPVILLFMVIAGIKYIMVEEPAEAIAARKSVLDAVLGGICVLLLLAAAEALGVPVYC
ncbi:MAG: hypothetical protein FJY77_03135 [Candidatus Altiarchaeales archaeon]|nr:hypothetical protein [Candidatus Altiarchaeales archaeon]